MDVLAKICTEATQLSILTIKEPYHHQTRIREGKGLPSMKEIRDSKKRLDQYFKELKRG